MTFTVILFVARRSHQTPSTFKHDYETNYIPLLKSIVGHDFPLSHTRHYVEHDGGSHHHPPFHGTVPNTQAGFQFDVVTVYTFISHGHWERFQEKFKDWEGDSQGLMSMEGLAFGTSMSAEEREGRVKMLIAGDTKCTGRDGGAVGWRFVGSV
ncbi:hypothetical protein B0J11DRAFT_37284 [Dendryphion nanum]|uniref:EthD domain-containing protein n=1 Tax=Dendryphion nanum TaxID=256645 RepID=A0A9P9IXD5_9PLEO|nr:hypothetical protein B0J11DRAFT_37284 [Dendryphion nanum]